MYIMASNSRKRMRLDLETKRRVLDFLEQPVAMHEKAAKEFGIAQPIITKIATERDVILAALFLSNRELKKKICGSTRIILLTEWFTNDTFKWRLMHHI
jgi:hypothetical protein